MAKSEIKYTKEWKALKAKLDRADRAHVKVGILASKGGNKVHDPKSGLTVAEIGAVHEYGSPARGIPQRAWIRPTFVKRADDLKKLTAKAAKRFVEGKVSLARALDILGAWGANAVKQNVTGGARIPPPNAPATIRRKKSTRTLVDSGRMVGAVSWEVVDAGEEGRGGFRK